MPKRIYVDVAPAVVLPSQARQVYTYYIPLSEKAPALYTVVRIPFSHRIVVGVVMAVHHKKVPYRTKECQEITDVVLTEKQVLLATWVAGVAQGGLGYTLRLFIPPLTKARIKEDIEDVQSLSLKPPRVSSLIKKLKSSDCAVIDRGRNRQTQLRDVCGFILSSQKQVLFLVPERLHIDRWVQYFADQGYPTLPIHADLSVQTLRRSWHRIQTGEPVIIIGTQKALWFPHTNVGLVVMEQEYYPTYKQWDQYPRMHTWYVVQMLKTIHTCPVLYSSSLPSLRLWHFIQEKKITMVGKLPSVHHWQTTPFSFEDRIDRKSIPNTLIDDIKHWYVRKKRILLLYNKKGAFRAVVCSACHTRLLCDDCGITLMLHKQDSRNELSCPNCGKHTPLPEVCPTCTRKKLVPIGLGNEKMEYIFGKILGKNSTIIRLDTSIAKTVSPKILDDSPALVIATSAIFSQVLSKKFDIVVWFLPEKSFLYPDFRSVERSYYLAHRMYTELRSSKALAYMATRAEHAINAVQHSPEQFFREQLHDRKRFGYPPFHDVVVLTTHSKQDQNAYNRATSVRAMLEARMKQYGLSCTVRGPFQSFQKKEKGLVTWHLMLLGKLDDLQRLYEQLPIDRVDVDPQRIL